MLSLWTITAHVPVFVVNAVSSIANTGMVPSCSIINSDLLSSVTDPCMTSGWHPLI